MKQTIRLLVGAPVSGRVTDENGLGVAGARVLYQGAGDWTQRAGDTMPVKCLAADLPADPSVHALTLPLVPLRLSRPNKGRARDHGS